MPKLSKAKYRSRAVVERTNRQSQPFNVWFKGRIIWFAQYKEEADEKLRLAIRQVQQLA